MEGKSYPTLDEPQIKQKITELISQRSHSSTDSGRMEG